jgi:hypothetical protein
MVVRGGIKPSGLDRAKRSQNLKFVFLTEMTGLLAWLAVLITLVDEGIKHHWRDPFDGDAKGVVALEILMS